jgi:predicted tellurium resistance membrane protein TerC
MEWIATPEAWIALATLTVLEIALGIDNIVVIAIVLAVGVMMLSAEGISRFIHRHPTVKMLASSFLLLIGMALVAEGLGQHIPKGYLYFAMGFSIFVEMLNIRAGKGTAGTAVGAGSPD